MDEITHQSSSQYNIGGQLIINGEVDYALLMQAVQQLVDENDALRLQINDANGQPQLSVRPCINFDLPFIDFSQENDAEEIAQNWLQETFMQPFAEGVNAIYWSFALVKIRHLKYSLLTKYHHLIADGWTTKIVIDRLAELYNAFLFQTLPSTAELAHYFDFIHQEQQYLTSPAFKLDSEFWGNLLPQLPEPLIQNRYQPSSLSTSRKANIHRFTFKRDFYNQLEQWSADNQVTTYQLLFSLLCLYFARSHQRNNLTIGIPVLNRSGKRFKKVLGMFASLSPLAINIDMTNTTLELIRQCSKLIRQVHKHQRYPLSAINQRLQLLKNKRESLFDIVLSFERQDYNVTFGEADVQARQMFCGVARFPLAVTICEFNNLQDVEVILESDETCFKAEELSLLAGRFHFILQQIIDNPFMQLQDVDLLPGLEKNFILQKFNSVATPPKFVSVLNQFQYWVSLQPDSIAISLLQKQLTYLELDDLSNILAHQMRVQSCDIGSIVLVCMPRCIETVISLLAIFKIRGVYLPIDSDSPIERIADILEISQAKILLTIDAVNKSVKALHPSILLVDKYQSTVISTHKFTCSSTAEDIAYVIFTSGSSGKPKGTIIDHRALAARLMWLQKSFNIRPDESVGQTIQTNFDPSLIEIFLALISGARLALAPWQRVTQEAFADFILTEKINALALVPTSLKALLSGLKESSEEIYLRVACCGGETLPVNLANKFIARTGAILFNVYGPTEATILASAWLCNICDGGSIPIGHPIDNTEIYIVDQSLKLLPIGVIGEIVIGGIGVGKGYLHQPEMTSKAFINNPFSTNVNSLLYRTGDCGYIGVDGQLYFSERLDRQVKISGYRIELAEIESVLMQHPKVQLAAVEVFSKLEKKFLVAFVEINDGNYELFQHEIADFLRSRLPDYMLPRKITVLDALPTTETGKINYSGLPVPNFANSNRSKREPNNYLETQLLDIWRQTLKKHDLYVDDNFFELDTDSLTALNLLIQIEKITGCRHSVAFLISFPTVEMQAEQLSQTQITTKFPIISTLSKRTSQKHFYLAASGIGDQLRFQMLADALGESCIFHMLYPSESDGDQTTIENLACAYAQAILNNHHQEFYIGGFSIGGITALETAYILEQQNHAPCKLILLDTVYPHWPLMSPWFFKMLKWLSGLSVFDSTSFNGRILKVMLADPGIIVQLNGLCRHKIRPFKGATELVISTQMRVLFPWLFSAWNRVLGNKVTRHYIPGLHGAIFNSKYLPSLVEIMQRCLLR